jgi:hypothetical protein
MANGERNGSSDTGGNANYADKDPMFRYLRVRGKLPPGSVITVEPGIYFCDFIIRPYLKDPLHAKYIDEKTLDKYWDVGGVRYVTGPFRQSLATLPYCVKDEENIC